MREGSDRLRKGWEGDVSYIRQAWDIASEEEQRTREQCVESDLGDGND